MQLFPTASVLPQGLVLVANAKSPLTAMPLMFSVPVPELVTVTDFAAAVAPTTTLPQASEVAERVTTGPPEAAVTVRETVVVSVRLPDTPVMVTVDVPVAAEALAVRVKVLVEVVGFVLNPDVTPLGRPEADNVTLPVKPSTGVTVIVLVPLLPWLMVTLVGDADSVKLGCWPPELASALIKAAPVGLPQPVAKS